ncbi:MAG: type II secretion system protein GspG [Kiritimatiellia bacterium]
MFINYVHDRAASDVQGFQFALERFHAQYGRFPPEATWADELIPAGREVINKERKVFLELPDMEDGWGNSYVYRQPGLHNPQSFDFYSKGADGISETGGNDPDDIAFWHHPIRRRYHYDDDFRISVRAGLAGLLASLVFAVRWRLRMRPTPPA